MGPGALPPSLKRLALAEQLGGVLLDEQEAPDHPRLGPVPALRGRVLVDQQAVFSEELYLRRQRYRLQFTTARSWLFLVLEGALAVDLQGRDRTLLLDAQGACLCLTRATSQEFTTLGSPVRLLRFGLPELYSWQPVDWSGVHPMPLMGPMLQLLHQAHHNKAPDATRERLVEALQSYCVSELAVHGVELQASREDPLQVLLDWLPSRLEQELHLADLASAACLSARRLQELCQQRFGCTPMDLLRQQRLEALHAELLDPVHAKAPMSQLYRRWQLPDSAATRQAFLARYGQTPQAIRKKHRASLASR